MARKSGLLALALLNLSRKWVIVPFFKLKYSINAKNMLEYESAE